MKSLRAPTQEQAGALIAIVAVIFGGWVRLLIPWMAGFPVNDGGLFYVMLRAVQANGLRIPAFIQYNGMSIPFAYPPFGFYFGAIVANVFRVDAIKVLQWLPAVVLIAAIPAFYTLAKVMLGTSFRAGIATLIFAFTPRAITWQIMGGGLTRSFGQLFMILALAGIYLTFENYNRKRLAAAIVFSSLVVLSHPEAALQAVGTAILVFLFKGRSKQGVFHAIQIGAGTLIVTAIWWLPTVARFGPGILLSAAQTGQHFALAFVQPFLMNFVDEPLMSLVAVLGVIGFAFEASRRRALIPLWFLAPFLVEPRSAPTYAMIPLAMLAGIALTEVILPALAGHHGEAAAVPGANTMRSKPAFIFLVFVGIYILGDASYFGAQLAGTTLTPATRETFAWIKANTPEGSRFLVLTGIGEQFCDATLEWFPALTGRVSPFTIQGREWLQGAEFAQIGADAQAFRNCSKGDDPLACIEILIPSSSNSVAFDYILVPKSRPILAACRVVDRSNDGERLIEELRTAPNFAKLYESEDAAVFKKR